MRTDARARRLKRRSEAAVHGFAAAAAGEIPQACDSRAERAAITSRYPCSLARTATDRGIISDMQAISDATDHGMYKGHVAYKANGILFHIVCSLYSTRKQTQTHNLSDVQYV